MLMPSNAFRQAIVSGKPQIGLWISLCSPFAAKVVREAGKPVGTLVSNPVKAIELLNSGLSFVACGNDAGLLARGAGSLPQSVRDGIV